MVTDKEDKESKIQTSLGEEPSVTSVTFNQTTHMSLVETLECGTSLAEQEHCEGETVNNRLPLLINKTGVDTTQAEIHSVDSLRAALASDALTGTSPGTTLQTFSSPFETPKSLYKSGISDRYLSVPLVYCDQTASNRPVKSIERYLERTCLPHYGNTHTNTSLTGSQSTAFVAEARQIVAEATNAKITGKASLDVVLFAGNGCTSAVALLIDCLGISHAVQAATKDNQVGRPVVFMGPFEHHSNILPWREAGCEIVMVPQDVTTHTVDIKALEQLLQSPEYNGTGRIKMGTFTAASNVTGAISDVDEIAATLHRHGALAFFDYATGAPYLHVDMNPPPSEKYPNPSLVAKDAIFLSPHKMVGGVGTPGVLILKKNLVNQVNAPRKSGGGTVFYVTSTHHRFLSNRMERYEGGTPNVPGILRTGLAFLYKRHAEHEYEKVVQHRGSGAQDGKGPPRTLLEYDFHTHNYVVQTLQQTAPNLIFLGLDNLKEEEQSRHLPIFSFLIKCGKRFLHYNYVCALLNDVFGIQSRGGCQCAGPFSQRLLGLACRDESGNDVPNEANREIEHALVHYKEKAELLRPGFTRLSLPFKGVRREEVDYVLKALEWVARNGWLIMCQYRCNHRTGEWRHHSRQGRPLGSERKWLSHYTMLATTDELTPSGTVSSKPSNVAQMFQQALENADALLLDARTDRQRIEQAVKMTDAELTLGGGGQSDDDFLEKLRWYTYPKECAMWIKQGHSEPPATNTEELSGAIRPGGGNDDQTTAFARTIADVRSPVSPVCDSRKRKYSKSADSVPTREDDSSWVTDDTHFIFRDGEEHTGEAPLEEIQAGFEDGELSDECEIYDKKSDLWVSLKTYLEANKKPRTETKEDQAEHGDISSTDDTHFIFRDGEEHTGEAPLEEIQAGFEDGELSDECEIYDKKSDLWVSLKTYLEANKKPCTETKEDQAEHGDVYSLVAKENARVVLAQPMKKEMSGDNTPRVEMDASNQRKKPSRDSSTWGKGSFATVAAAEVTAPLSALSLAVPNKTSGKKNKRGRGIKPPPKMMRYITQAIIQWNMIEEGDRLLLGLSGGKDSLSLLHCLLEFQRKLPTKFEIQVCTIDPMTPSFDPSPLIPYVESLGLKYHYIRDDIVTRASSSGKDGKVVSSLCAYCARMKRGNLYTCARNNQCNKLVLAQHLDDCAESFFMSSMHNGFLRTMKAHYQINAGDLSVIRPMVYCRESLMTEFAKAANLPVINENCPACFEEPKERARIKKLLSREETLYPNLFDNIRRSLIPLMHDDSAAILRCYTEEAVSKSRKEPHKNGKQKKKKRKQEEESQAPNVSMVCTTEPQTAGESVASIALAAPSSTTMLLSEASDDDLVKELARRKAEKFRLAEASRAKHRNDDGVPKDPTGQVCTLNGGNGSIPCRELME